jgi:hypothetical protein
MIFDDVNVGGLIWAQSFIGENKFSKKKILTFLSILLKID